MKNYDYSVFKEGGKWYAQLLKLPDEEVVHLRSFSNRGEAAARLEEWRKKYGN